MVQGCPLSISFSSLYAEAASKEVRVAEVRDSSIKDGDSILVS